MYTTTSQAAQEIATELGFIANLHFVEVDVRRDGKTYIRHTAGHISEIRALKSAVESAAYKGRPYVYTGRFRTEPSSQPTPAEHHAWLTEHGITDDDLELAAAELDNS